MSLFMRRIGDELRNGRPPAGWSWLNSIRVVVNPAHRRMLRAADLDTIEGMLRCDKGEVIAHDRKQQKNEVRRLEVEHGGARYNLFLKRYYNYLPDKIWKRAFRGAYFPPSMVKAEYENLEKLSRWGFHVPEPVAYGEHRFAGALINAYLVTLEIPEAMGLDYLIREWLPRQSASVQKETRANLIQHLADALRAMHERGFEHHDLFFRNLMVSGLDVAKLYVMDAPRGKQWPRFLMRFRRVQDLATLDAAATWSFRRPERMRFLLRYLGRKRLTRSDKALIRKILKVAEPWRERQITRLDRAIVIDGDGKAASVSSSNVGHVT